MKARSILRVLERRPLNYRVARSAGSHRRLKSADYPPFTFAFHDRDTISGGLMRRILVNDVGLSEAQARELL